MSNVKVSIIIPVYNTEQYIKDCIDSVINQTLKEIEIILVDDGSTDSCPKICDEYAQNDCRIKIIHKKNEGLGKAYNTGIDLAAGEYVGFVESDDFIELNMFEVLYNTAKEQNADIVKSNWFNYWSKPYIVNTKANSYRGFDIGKATNIKKVPKLLKIAPSIWTSIYKKDFLTINNIRFLETYGASYQDTSFAFKTTAAAEQFVLLDESFVHYRQDNEYSSVKSQSKVFAICEEYKEIERFLNNNPQIKKDVKAYKWVNQYNGYKWNLNRISEKYHRDFLEEFSTTFKQVDKQNLINDGFFKEINAKDFDLLINDKNKYLKKLIKNKKKTKYKEIRQKLISLRLTPNQIRFSFLGKEYFNWEKHNG